MLNKKRNLKRPQSSNLKHKPISSKLKHVPQLQTKKPSNDEESIHSNSDIESVKSDSVQNIPTQKSTNKLETIDEKRTRLAKELLNKLSKDKSSPLSSDNEDNDNDNENITSLNKKLLSSINREISEHKFSYFNNKETPFTPKEISFLKCHKSTITDLDISNDNSFIITSSKDTRAIIYDINKSTKSLLPQFTKKALNCCILSPDNKTAYFGGKDKNIYHIDLQSNKLIQKIKAHNESVTGLVFDSSKDQFYSIGNDHLLKVWSGDQSTQCIQLETFYGHINKVNCIKNIPGDVNRIITSGMDNFINLWKVDSQSFLQFNINDIYPVDCISALNTNVFLTGDFGGNICAWRSNNKKYIGKYEHAHGFQKQFKVNHSFFNGYWNTDCKGVDIKVGNPILSLGSVLFSDLAFSGSCKGEVNFYKVEEYEEKNKVDIQLMNGIKLEHGGCVNVIKENKRGDMLFIGNGYDGKIGRWDKDYNTTLGISVVKLY